jgi:glycosyltransferase involved in cell wall biosynthesis
LANPFLSVIIATRQRKRQLSRCLDSLTGQTYPRERWELIIVQDGEDQESESVVASLETRLSIRSFRQAQAGCGIARNTGAAEAQGEYLIFTDDDCILPPDWLSRYDMCFRNHPACMIAGSSLNWLRSNPYSQATQAVTDFLVQYSNSSPENARLALGNNMGMQAGAFLELGGFSPKYYRTAAEDRDFCVRWLAAGRRIFYDRSVIVFHAHQLGLRSFMRQHYNYGYGSFLFHRLQADRQQRTFRIEQAGFYISLLSHARSAVIGFLLVLSQVAHTMGFVSGYVSLSRRFGRGVRE